ncbi:MAG: dimethyladenosine transferase [Marmoricola sp.]|jgi:uncharacterized protein YndB with AHSA1/START domain|nr:dimethyladenosine transferase [Marmoricola sp.]
MTDSDYVRCAERTIPAAPHAIFALLSDPERHPDLDGSGTVRRVRASEGTLRVGSTFDMHMKRGFAYSTRNTVIELATDRLLAWQTRPLTLPLPWVIGGRIWRYELSEVEGGTHVVETWDLRPERNRALVRPMAGDPVADMSATLERLEELVS